MPQVLAGTLPAPTSDIVGRTGTGAITGTVSGSIAAVSFASNAGLVGGATSLAVTLPSVTGSITGKQGIGGSIAASLPAVLATFSAPASLAASLPAITASISGKVGNVGSVGAVLPANQASFTGIGLVRGTVSASLPAITGTFTGKAGIAGSMAATLGRVALAAQGYTGIIGTIAVSVPVVTASIDGHVQVTGSLSLSIPALQFVATARAPVATDSETFALQIGRPGLTEYTNYGFNSMAAFNGVYLGAKDGGIYALTGADDDGTAIDAVARLGITDFGSATAKRVDSLWAGYTSSGDMEVRVIVAGEVVATYPIDHVDREDPHNGRAKIGQGLNMRYWQFEVANVDGADFTIDTLEAIPHLTPRRHRG